MVNANALMNKEIAKTAKQNNEGMIGILCDLRELLVQTTFVFLGCRQRPQYDLCVIQSVLSVPSV